MQFAKVFRRWLEANCYYHHSPRPAPDAPRRHSGPKSMLRVSFVTDLAGPTTDDPLSPPLVPLLPPLCDRLMFHAAHLALLHDATITSPLQNITPEYVLRGRWNKSDLCRGGGGSRGRGKNFCNILLTRNAKPLQWRLVHV